MVEPPRAKPPKPPGSIMPATRQTSVFSIFGIVFLVAFSTAGIATLATVVTHIYGFGLFMLLPVATGFVSAWLCNRGREWNWLRTWMVLSLTLAFTGFFMLGGEGVFCLMFAAVIAAVLAAVGAVFAWLVSKMTSHHRTILCIICGIAPMTMGVEWRFKPAPPILEQTTVIEINAPPQVVWQFVPAFPKIETSPSGLLANGMAYPIEATMHGSGIGARRECILSTGNMPEIVTRWEPAHALEFDVLNTPPAMTETNPLFKVTPRHIEGYFIVKRGRFLLTPLEGGRTRIEGTSWFQHGLWPQAYWAPLSRRVVKAVHERVLEHIKELAEQHSPK